MSQLTIGNEASPWFPKWANSSSQPRQTTMFLTGSTTAGEKFFLEAFKWIYTPKMDKVIEEHICNHKTARDTVTKLPPLSEQIEEMKREADAANAEGVAEDAEYEEDSDNMDDDLQASNVLKVSKSTLTP